MPEKKELARGAPALSVRIMQVYARMTPPQRWALFSAAQIITTAKVGPWSDTMPAGALQTDFNPFDPER